jgi:hypothetical protein
MNRWTPGYLAPCCLMVAMLVTTGPGWAQSTTATTTATNPAMNPQTNLGTNPAMNPQTPPGTNPAMNAGMNPRPDPATAGDFRQLSPGNQKIAQALFGAQRPATAGPRLTLDQIAELKETGGWGKVFRQMKADGLIQARNLGQVVSAHEHAIHAAGGGRVATTGRGGSTVITNGAGRSMVVANSTRSSGRFAGGGTRRSGGGAGSANITTAAGSPVSAGGVVHGGGGAEHGGGHGK